MTAMRCILRSVTRFGMLVISVVKRWQTVLPPLLHFVQYTAISTPNVCATDSKKWKCSVWRV